MNKKAFTLIELLAVIVIIGIIAIITVPKIKDSLEKSKENIAKTSAKAYTRVIDEYILNEKMNMEKINLNGTYNIDSNGKLYNLEKEYDLKFDGKNPKNGVLVYNKNELVSGCITVDKYRTTFENGNIISTEKGTCEYDRMLTPTEIQRRENLKTLASAYIIALKESEFEESGIKELSELDSYVEFNQETPTSGWVSLLYNETNGITVFKYSLKYGENEVITFDGINQAASNTLASKPAIAILSGVDGKTIGDEITIGTEHFYVLENTGTKINALAKANLNVGRNASNNFTEGLQGEVGTNYPTMFSSTDFWLNPEATSSPYVLPDYRIGTTNNADIYDPENYAGSPEDENFSIAYYVLRYNNYLNTAYPTLHVTSRLLYKEEYAAFKTNYESILTTQRFWLGTGTASKSNDVQKANVYVTNLGYTVRSNTTGYGTRPVIEIPISNY